MAAANIFSKTTAEYGKEREKKQEKRDTIGNGLAEHICDQYARKRMASLDKERFLVPYGVCGEYEKTVKVNCFLDNPVFSFS